MMHFLDNYDTFLFDLDGLLINTEETHFKAYERTCQKRGYTLPWTFHDFIQMAHYSSTAVRDYVYQTFPKLKEEAPDWQTIHQEKTANFLALLEEGAVDFMPGAAPFLKWALDSGKSVAIVTNSLRSLVDAITVHLPLLKEVPLWLTRECYAQSKPAPDGYLLAYEKIGKRERTIGFEDTPRGIEALLQTPIQAVIISTFIYPEIERFKGKGVVHYSSFEELLWIVDSDKEKALSGSCSGAALPIS
jgi:HAD superfamily hydrolase (TIGR01509 family)